ncbi:MAG: glycosyltransferase family 4 protein, partial [Actinomycetota bacterium]
MRVVFCAWRDLAHQQAGGSEVLVDHLARGLGSRGHDVRLLCSVPVAERPYRVQPLLSNHLQYFHAPLAFHRGHRDADVVIDVANGVAFYAGVWSRRPSLCLVNHVHTDQWDQWFATRRSAPLAGLGRFLESRVMPWAYRDRLFVAVSESTATALEGIGVDASRIRVVHNGVEQSPSPEA